MAIPEAETLAAEILARLEADPKKDTERDALILAALEGDEAPGRRPQRFGQEQLRRSLELLLTGETYRWKKPRATVWREGWRNLHHRKAAIEAEFYVEGDKPTKVVSEWKDGADLAAALRGRL